MIYTEHQAMEIIARARRFQPGTTGDITRVYIAAGSQSTQHLTAVLQYLLSERGIPSFVKSGEYGSFRAEISDESSELHEFKPEFVIILPCDTDALDLREMERLWKILGGKTVIQANFVTPLADAHGRFANNIENATRAALQKLNLEMCRKRPPNVIIADLDDLAARIGKRQWFDPVAYFVSKSAFAMKLIPEVADYFAGIISAVKGKTRKCLVLDLDNTLWGGIVGEDGAQALALDPNDAKGEAFRAFQGYVKSLKERGVILAVASKNEEIEAKAPFSENRNMVLSLDDFACFKANWNDKATSLREIAEELNIGVDSLVFFDDNPAEREIVSAMLPGVLVVDVPKDPARYVQALYDSGAFDIVSLSAEDLSRTASYVNDARRSSLETSSADYDDYLKSLEMSARAVNLDSGTPRFSQLINKSNQFNLRTRRYTEAEIDAMAKDDACTLLGIEFKDRFDYYGMISCVILKYEGAACFIDTWVMSCRVLKRGIENFVFNAIVDDAKARGAEVIIGEYLPTGKNFLVRELLDDFGFLAEAKPDGGKRYTLLPASAEKRKHFIGEIKNDKL